METDKVEKETAHWNNTEMQQFIQFLVDHKFEGGDSGTFKSKTLTTAVQHIAPYHNMGVIKGAKHLQTK